jgi:hypothetical protein
MNSRHMLHKSCSKEKKKKPGKADCNRIPSRKAAWEGHHKCQEPPNIEIKSVNAARGLRWSV